MSSIEFRTFDDSLVEVSDEHVELLAKGRKRLITDRGRAIEIWRGKHRDLLLTRYLARQKPKPRIEVVVVPEAKAALAVEVIEQVAEIDVTPPPVIDGGAVSEEKYSPLPDEWLQVQVERLSKNRRALFLSLTTDDEVFCDPKTISASPGDHKLCLPPGSIGAARIELARGGYQCLEAQIEGAYSEKEEVGRVVNWSEVKTCGWVERPCGDWLFVFGTDEHIYGVIGVGDCVRFNVERSKKRQGYVGTGAHKIDAPLAQEKKV